jgi:hypothetical protein
MDSSKEHEKVYVESFMTEEEENKVEFNSEDAINSFIIKKDYFVMHRDGNIFKDYDVGSKKYSFLPKFWITKVNAYWK